MICISQALVTLSGVLLEITVTNTHEADRHRQTDERTDGETEERQKLDKTDRNKTGERRDMTETDRKTRQTRDKRQGKSVKTG